MDTVYLIFWIWTEYWIFTDFIYFCYQNQKLIDYVYFTPYNFIRFLMRLFGEKTDKDHPMRSILFLSYIYKHTYRIRSQYRTQNEITTKKTTCISIHYINLSNKIQWNKNRILNCAFNFSFHVFQTWTYLW